VRVAAGAGLGFLLAVLWFDLMFDVQARGHHGAVVPGAILDSIAAYYRRVTTAARPMNRLIALVMLVTLGVLVGEIVQGDVHAWVAWSSLALTAIGVGLAGARTVPHAVRLGTQTDPVERQSALARSILRDHVVCLVVIVGALVLQVTLG
jgi:hypothetical protein